MKTQQIKVILIFLGVFEKLGLGTTAVGLREKHETKYSLLIVQLLF